MKDGAFFKNIQIYRKGHLPKLLLTKVTIYPKSFDRNCHLPKWLFTQKIYTQISFTEKAVTEVDYTHRTAHGTGGALSKTNFNLIGNFIELHFV